MKKHIMTGGVCAPKGFMASGVAADINCRGNDKKDLALIFSEVPAVAAAVFTTNRVKAAPITLTQSHLQEGLTQAVIINARNANSCTGEQGERDALAMAHLTADALHIAANRVAVASTGLIGVPLPMNRLERGIPLAKEALSVEGGHLAAQAIMTTDTYPKEIAIQIELGGGTVTIGGMAKGSGMVNPNMATVLGFITTDAKISLEALQVALKRANEKSFNMITVDGDTSTNDMILIMANGLSNTQEIQLDTPLFDEFLLALEHVLIHLAKEVARDGEGATKLLEVRIEGAACVSHARKAAQAVCNSLLVKTALFGRDANWGRILCALGYSGAEFDPQKVDLYLGDLVVMKRGTPLQFDEEAALLVLSEHEVVIVANLQNGEACATGWGCDLSYDYVRINGAYRT